MRGSLGDMNRLHAKSGLQRLATRAFFSLVDTQGGSVDSFALGANQTRSFEVHFSGPPNNEANAFQGVIVVVAAGGTQLPVADSIDATVAADVAGEHEARRSGRAVLYPGVDALVGTVTVGHVLTRSGIERVSVLGGPPPGIDVLIDTRDFVRPQWKDGRLTLIATPGSGDHIAPFEFPNPKACGGGH